MKTYILIFVLIITLITPAAATAKGNIAVYIDGEETYFDPSPVIVDGHTMVPMRLFFESLGAEVYWESETNTVIGISGDVEIRIMIGSNVPTINGMTTMISAPARLINGTTFVPLRFIGEALGSTVVWEPSKKEISITTNTGDVKIMQDIPTFNVVSSQTGIASWYGNEFAGRPTSSGEIFNPYDFTAAHRELPFGTLVKVTFLRTGKEILVRINDRGPHIRDRIIDLSQAAAEAIGLKPYGIGEVLMEVLK
jgi:hypothetical protein